jgi:hypothetical protein
MEFTNSNSLGSIQSTSPNEKQTSPDKLQKVFKTIDKGNVEELSEILDGVSLKTLEKFLGRGFCNYNQNPETFRKVIACILR